MLKFSQRSHSELAILVNLVILVNLAILDKKDRQKDRQKERQTENKEFSLFPEYI